MGAANVGEINVGKINVVLVLRSQQFADGMRSAGKSVGDLSNKVKQDVGNLNTAVNKSVGDLSDTAVKDVSTLNENVSKDVGGLSAVVKEGTSIVKSFFSVFNGAAAVIGPVAEMVNGQLTAIDALAQQADALGVTTQRLQAMNTAAELAGVSQSVMQKGLSESSVALSEAIVGVGDGAQWFDTLGLKAEELRGKKPDELFEAYAEAISKLPSHAERAAASSALFGDSTGEMLPLLDNGKELLVQTRKEMEEYGASITRVDAAKIEETNDSIIRAKTVAGTFIQSLTVGLAPIIETVAVGLTDWAAGMGGFGSVADKVIDFGVKGVGLLLDGWQGLRFLWIGAKSIIANMGKSMYGFVRSVVQGYNLITANTTNTWNFVKAKADVLFTRLGLMSDNWGESFTYVMASVKKSFAETVISLGRAAMNTGIKGLTSIGEDAVFAGADMLVTATRDQAESEKKLFGASEELKKSEARLAVAKNALLTGAAESMATPELDEKIATFQRIIDESTDEFHTLKDGPSASEKLTATIDNLRAESEAKAQAKAAEIAKEQEDRAASVAAEAEHLRAKAEMKAQAKLTELEGEQERLRAEQEQKTAAQAEKERLDAETKARELEAKVAHDLAMEVEEKRSSNVITAAWEEGQKRKEAFTKKHWSAQAKTIFGEMENLTKGSAKNNKTMFKINKVAALANAVINTSQGVSRTLAAYPYPWNIPMAGLHLAAGIAQVNSIRSSSFSGGGGGASAGVSSGGGSVSISSMGNNAVAVVPQEKKEEPLEPTRHIVSTESTAIDVLTGMEHIEAVRNGSPNADNSSRGAAADIVAESQPFVASYDESTVQQAVPASAGRTMEVHASEGDGLISGRWIADQVNEQADLGHPISRILVK